LKAIAHILIVSFLTLISQIGGLVWILVFGIFKMRRSKISKLKKIAVFITSYFFVSLLFIPPLAKLNNRVPLPISKSGELIPHNYLMPLLNRHYVKPRLKKELLSIADEMKSYNSDLKVSYLDANFPFLDSFPLLPHRSHDDGNKVDLSFYYTKDNQAGNLKPARSGYGVFEDPRANDINRMPYCKGKGHWQYDMTKYITLGSRKNLIFDQQNTRKLIEIIIRRPAVEKIFLEEHLEQRMNFTERKVRWQGCKAVRHDDHIHVQIK